MQLSSFIPILLIFISTVSASPLYTGPSNTGNNIQAISKRRGKLVPVPFPTKRDELKSILPSGIILDSSQLEQVWKKRSGDPIAGRTGYHSYEYSGGYEGTRAIFKGVWRRISESPEALQRIRVTPEAMEQEMIEEAFYLHIMGMLLGLVINENDPKGPNYAFIIKYDEEFITRADAELDEKQLDALRHRARYNLAKMFTTKPSFTWQSSYLFKKNPLKGRLEAIFV